MKQYFNTDILPNIMGIYKISRLNRNYIGYAHDIRDRLRRHQYQLSKKMHDNIFLQRTVNKYGFSDFRVEILGEYSEDMLIEKEIYFIKYFKSKAPNGFNMTDGGDGGDAFEFSRNHFSVVSPDNIVYNVGNMNQFSKDHNLSVFSLIGLKTGRTQYTKTGWRLSGTIEKVKQPMKQTITPYKVVNPSGQIFEVINEYQFGIQNNLYHTQLLKLRNGIIKHTNGWQLYH